MGQQAFCTARWAGRSSEGKLLLESDALVFRGEFRLAVPYREMKRVTTRDGWLTIEYAAGEASFELGPLADKWAHRILHPKSLIDKLDIKPVAAALVIDIPDEEFWQQLRAEKPQVTVTSVDTIARALAGPAAPARIPSVPQDAPFDMVLFRAETREELAHLPHLRRCVKPNGAVWVVTPRGKPEVRDVEVIAAARDAGLVDVKVVRFSGTHTALKLVVPVKQR
ncbi:MAG: DUF3052 family protein [Gemmatimonadetes bacterium]|nr:DUF3052 family protein [Gemmatimonadota bacterium]